MVAFFPVLALVASVVTVKNCGGAFGIKELSLSPTNPNPGDPMTLHLQYTVPSGMTITDGVAKYSVTYNFIPFTPTTESLCSNIPCPLYPGTYTNDTISTWPTGLSGSVTTQMSWLDPNGILLLCVSVSGKVRR